MEDLMKSQNHKYRPSVFLLATFETNVTVFLEYIQKPLHSFHMTLRHLPLCPQMQRSLCLAGNSFFKVEATKLSEAPQGRNPLTVAEAFSH